MAYENLTKTINNLAFSSYSESFCIKELNSENKTSDINIFHINIRSYSKNINQLLTYLKKFTFEFDCIILTEIWSSFVFSTDKNLKGYNCFYVLNELNKSGGVVIFVKEYLKACLIENSNNKNDFLLDYIKILFKINNSKYNLVIYTIIKIQSNNLLIN